MFEPKKLAIEDIEIICANFNQDENLENWNQSDFKNSLEDLTRPIYIIGDFGFAAFSQIIDEAEILMIWIAPKMRKNGYAKKLLDYSISQLQNQKVEKLFLEVAQNNYPAQALYKSLKFAQIGIRKKYYKNEIDALVYKLVL